MPLTSEEARSVFPIAWGLPVESTAPFIREVEAALANNPARGEGLAHRIAVELASKYFVPPPMPKIPPQFFNSRKPWLQSRA